MAFHSKYVCQQCGYESTGWLGKCPECGTWNSLVETVVSTGSIKGNKSTKSIKSGAKPVNLSDIKSSATKRISTKIPELDRVLGGGLVSGQATLIAGEPGIGKSTLLLEVADKLNNVLYVCGEESANQIAIRGKRLAISNKNIQLLEETDVDVVVEVLMANNYSLSAVIVDSIQTISTSDLSGMAGSVGQVRECAFRLIQACKSKNTPLFLVGHVTKEGTVAGPAVLAHVVDTVLWFEGDKTLTLRLLRAYKNRFGPTDEVGIFTMEEKGLVEVKNPSGAFLEEHKEIPGAVPGVVIEGTRPIIVEFQALVAPTKLAFPKRSASGVDSRRLELIVAVLTRRVGLPLWEYDIFVNVAGGLKVQDPASDLAIALAIASAFHDRPIVKGVAVVGEVGLLGEVRNVIQLDRRIKEAQRLGFKGVVSSKTTRTVSEAVGKYISSK